MQHQPAGGAGYQDPLIAIRDGELALRRYYFPTGTKRIRLAAITRVEEYAMSRPGRLLAWGSLAALPVLAGCTSATTGSNSLREVTAMCTLRLRAARRDEARLLSELALRSKGYWGYDQAFLDACRAELTLAPEEVENRRVTVAERDGQVVGFYALAGEPPEGTLADLFVAPERIRGGVGRALWEHAMVAARTLGFERLTLEADPGAEPFYLAMGARRIGSVPSGSIPGRVLPLLEVPIVGVEEC